MIDTTQHLFASRQVEDPATGLQTPWPGLYVKVDHTPRAQFSASQLETANCQYLWGLRYLIGLRQPEKKIETREEEQEALAHLPNVDKRERSLLFGTLLHKRLEHYMRGEAVDWTDDIGQRALVGLSFLPNPNAASGALRIEAPISLRENSVFGDLQLSFVGFVDLEDPDILYDYKTTGNFRWMKRPDELRENVAACLYALSSMQRKGTTIQRCRWVYFSSVGKPEARAVNFEITSEEALKVVRSAFVRAAGLRQDVQDYCANLDEVIMVRDSEARAEGSAVTAVPVERRLPLIDHLPRNTSVCNAYGGCPYHVIAGGPCNPGASMIDVSNVTEPKQPKETQEMATLAERLAAMNNQQQQPAPVTQQQAQAFQQQQMAPAQPGPAAFGAPPVSQDVLTGPAPAVAPFNPGANPFGQAPAPAAVQAVNPFAAQAAPVPSVPVATPTPTFAASSMPAGNPFAAPTGNPFGAAPVQQLQTPGTLHQGGGLVQPFPGVNSPEAVTAISADAAAAQPQGKRKRRTQAEMQAARAGTAAPTSVSTSDYDVTITITDNESGTVVTIPAPDSIAKMMVGAMGSVFEGLR